MKRLAVVFAMLVSACDIHQKLTGESASDSATYGRGEYSATSSGGYGETPGDVYGSPVMSEESLSTEVSGGRSSSESVYTTPPSESLPPPTPAQAEPVPVQEPDIVTSQEPARMYGSPEPDIVIYGRESDLNVPNRLAPTAPAMCVDKVTVVPGDTLYRICTTRGVSVNDVIALNNLSAPYAISPGQTLCMPNGGAKPVPVKETEVKKDTNVQTTLPNSAPRSNAKFSWPVRGKIISDWGPKADGLQNDGINIAANLGAPVLAAENGVVAYSGNELKGMGNLVILQHSGGWMTVYAHMDSLNVKRGAKVSVGDKIGTVGQTGKVSEPQLHFEIRNGSKAVDPKRQLK